jgi:hypothetical protein
MQNGSGRRGPDFFRRQEAAPVLVPEGARGRRYDLFIVWNKKASISGFLSERFYLKFSA